jgi:superoxide dismutase, Fe-Mn family
MTTYRLPDLPYGSAALEPVLSSEVVERHHSEHHAAYVRAANTTVERLVEARAIDDAAALVGLERTLAFNIAGHVLHSIYWRNLSPHGGREPDGELAARISRDIGTMTALRSHMTAVGRSVQGSGWSVLAYEPLGDRLIVQQVHDHHVNHVPGAVPLLVIDVWEHAYYSQYGAKRADYLDAIWSIVDWQDVDARLARARADVVHARP